MGCCECRHFCLAARLQLLPRQPPGRHPRRRVDKVRIEREARAAAAATATNAAAAAAAAAVAVAVPPVPDDLGLFKNKQMLFKKNWKVGKERHVN